MKVDKFIQKMWICFSTKYNYWANMQGKIFFQVLIYLQ